MPNPALGRGLDALLSRKRGDSQLQSAAIPVHVSDRTNAVIQLPVDVIQANIYQPRKEFDDQQLTELAESIKEYGIIQPLVVTQEKDSYRLVAGERRLRAAKQLGMSVVPVILRDTNEHQRLALALIENIQRVDLNPIECAHAYKRLKDEFNLTQEEIARRVGKSRPVVTNTLRFLNLPESIQDGIRKGAISEGHGKLIMGLSVPEDQMHLFQQILEKKLNVRQTDTELQMLGKKRRRIASPSTCDYALSSKEELLRNHLGTHVSINSRGEGGTIIISFHSREQLHEILNTIIHD